MNRDIQECFADLLLQVDPEPTREGIKETPERAMKAWREYTSGYAVDIKSLFKTFEDGSQSYDEMIMVANIPVYSHCEHHLAAIFGTATVAYIPDKRIVGLSKMNRVVDAFARRLQVQERMTVQIAEAMEEHLQPKGVGVILKCRHFCMEARGIRQAGTHTLTSALRGVFKEGSPRAEFLSFANKG